MTIQGISHIGVGVTNLDRSVTFYRDLLGFAVVREDAFPEHPSLVREPSPDARTTVVLKAGEVLLVMGGTRAGTPGPVKLDEIGNHHLSFLVDDLEALHRKLVEAGVRCLLEPKSVDPGRASGLSEGGLRTGLYEDPDGICFQLDQRS